MSYFRRGMGDGPITSPNQVDPELPVVIGTVGPTRVDCDALPSDSPFRMPGQVCAPSIWGSITDILTGGASGAAAGAGPGQTSDSGIPTWVWIGAAGAALYLATRKKKA